MSSVFCISRRCLALPLVLSQYDKILFFAQTAVNRMFEQINDTLTRGLQASPLVNSRAGALSDDMTHVRLGIALFATSLAFYFRGERYKVVIHSCPCQSTMCRPMTVGYSQYIQYAVHPIFRYKRGRNYDVRGESGSIIFAMYISPVSSFQRYHNPKAICPIFFF